MPGAQDPLGENLFRFKLNERKLMKFISNFRSFKLTVEKIYFGYNFNYCEKLCFEFDNESVLF